MAKKRYFGTVIAKKRRIGIFGDITKLYVDYGEGIKIFENAVWILKKYELGDKVTWINSWLYSNGANNLKKVEEHNLFKKIETYKTKISELEKKIKCL